MVLPSKCIQGSQSFGNACLTVKGNTAHNFSTVLMLWSYTAIALQRTLTRRERMLRVFIAWLMIRKKNGNRENYGRTTLRELIRGKLFSRIVFFRNFAWTYFRDWKKIENIKISKIWKKKGKNWRSRKLDNINDMVTFLNIQMQI